MGIRRFIPGMPLRDSLRGLLMMTPGSAPRVALRDRASSTQKVCRVTRLTPSAAFDAWLTGAHDLALYALEATSLDPATDYEWDISGDPTRFAARTLPAALPAEGLAVAASSCHYDYFNTSTNALASFRAVQKRERVAFRLLLGDNLYLDVAPDQRRFSDGYEETAHRYARYWAQGDYGELLSACASSTTWDDHEFWNNYPERQPHLSRSWESRRAQYEAAAQEGIALFQLPLNPPPTRPGGRCHRFSVPPLHVFVADTRTSRTRCRDQLPRLMDDEDLAALERWLTDAAMRGPRVLVLGQPLFLSEGTPLGMDWNPPAFKAQYQRILRAIDDSPWDVLVVSGDVHFSRLIEHQAPGARHPVREFVSSPMCHVPTVGSILKHGLWGADLVMGRDAVEAPPVGRTRWYFGTDVPCGFGVLRFTPVGEAISVDAMFIDALTPGGRVARAILPERFSGDILRRDLPCEGRRLFTLTKR